LNIIAATLSPGAAKGPTRPLHIADRFGPHIVTAVGSIAMATARGEEAERPRAGWPGDFFQGLGNPNDARMRSRAWCGHGRDGSAALPPGAPLGRRFKTRRIVMLKIRIIVFVAAIGLATGAAAVLAKGGAQSPDFAPPQIDTYGLLSKAGDLPVEIAPEI
jgi:hypothetical protein